MKRLLTLWVLRACTAAIVIGWNSVSGYAQESRQDAKQILTDQKLEELSLEDLLKVEIVSASNKAEKLSDAPATVIVLNYNDIVKRGYLDLAEIFDDLPGMDIARPYGDTFFKNYWRGYRNSIGSPYLLMVDNIILNNLYFNEAEGMPAIPVSNIERIEVVYGPASAVYGPNAFMGVINIITRKDRDSNGTSVRAHVSGGSLQRRIADLNVLHKHDAFRISLSGRFDVGVTDTVANGRYEYTKPDYTRNRRLWGTLLDNPNLAGNPESPHQNTGVDVRMFLGNTEAGLLVNTMRSGYGNEYPFDAVQPHAVWSRPQLSAHLRHVQAFSSQFSSSTLVRYRESSVSNDSYFVEGYGSGAQGNRVLDVSFWQALCSSISLFQDFSYTVSDALSFNAGLKYERRDLQKAYDVNYGPAILADSLQQRSYPMPPPPPAILQYQNRIIVTDEGAYIQGKYRATNLFGSNDEHNITAGARLDNNSVYGQAFTIRAGYVGKFDKIGVKVLYGQAFQEPTPRQLFGGWQGAGSDPALKPERSSTLEGSLSYTAQNISVMVNPYLVNNENTIVNVRGGAQNLGARDVFGVDAHLQGLWQPGFVKQLSLWLYYSFISGREKQIIDGLITDTFGRIGDLADHKIYFGANCDITENLNLTLRARFIGERITIASNPVGSIAPYFTMDLSLGYANLFAPGVGLAVRCANLFDAHYFHPGIRDGGAGTTPGFFDATNIWRGSQTFYSSLLAQPGRTVQVVLLVNI
jgi:outer membrane cobalamin receptor